MAEIPVLETERLVLRPFRENDAPDVARILSTPRMSEHTLRFANPYPVEMAREWIGQHNVWAEQGLHLQWAITLPNDVLVGTVSLALQPGQSHGDLGYWVDANVWGRGYAPEAARAVLDYGFSALQLSRIEAKCFATNAASIRVLEKVGLRLERVLPGFVVDDDGRTHDVILYAISQPSQSGLDASLRPQSQSRPGNDPSP